MILPALAQSDSVAKVLIPGGGSGSCTVVKKIKPLENGWLGIAATAWHVAYNRETGAPERMLRVFYKNGQSCSGVYPISADKGTDTAIICTWIPDEVEEVPLWDGGPPEMVTLHGYPYGEVGSTGGKYLRTFQNQHYADILVAPGYSGGGAFADGKLFGVISGGWFWEQHEGKTITWPTRSGAAGMIREMIANQQDANLK